MARGARFSLGRGDLSPDRRHFRVPAAPPRVFRGALTRVAVGRGDVREVFLGAAERGRGGEEDKRTGGEAERRRGGEEGRRRGGQSVVTVAPQAAKVTSHCHILLLVATGARVQTGL